MAVQGSGWRAIAGDPSDNLNSAPRGVLEQLHRMLQPNAGTTRQLTAPDRHLVRVDEGRAYPAIEGANEPASAAC
jgi:hypothetical protein